MASLLTVSEVAREIEKELGTTIKPRIISDLFYQRQLPENLAPIVGGRRLISQEALPRIRDLVRNVTTDIRAAKKGDNPGM